jgi:hypothetical protein
MEASTAVLATSSVSAGSGDPLDPTTSILMLCKGAAPAVSEIEGGEAEDEQGVVSSRARSKERSQSAPEIGFGLFSFHNCFAFS